MNMRKIIKKIVPKSILNLRHLFFAWLGSVIYRAPSKRMYVIGVTGTSGKSTTIYLLRQLLESVGFKVGALSTIEFCVSGECQLNDKKMTMLGRMAIQKYLRRMITAGCEIAIVETTSEGRVQYRHRYINYDMMVLTNLYPEHIESHGSFEAYKKAKLDIFEYVSKCKRKYTSVITSHKGRSNPVNNEIVREHLSRLYVGATSPEASCNDRVEKTVIVNAEYEYKDEFMNFNFDKKVTFGKGGEFCPIGSVTSEVGLSFKIGDKLFETSMFGEYNIMNIASVVAIARSLGVDWSGILESVSNFKSVPGRLEFIPEANKFGIRVIVDYAFEPVAMTELYKVAKILKPRKIIHVFGSTGGGRDTDRREKLGNFIGSLADYCIITDEDPYDEDPWVIIDEVAEAVKNTGKKENETYFKIIDRGEAIRKAIILSEPDDLVLITGKGSEQAIVVKDKLLPWDDRESVREALAFK
ncbi:MAG: UDP-N-acetylmuramyl-tripeptide synthetase [bacterium]|nr:UDP-N-acetylmuramyl-tripeptide synthetase [bacterium]